MPSRPKLDQFLHAVEDPTLRAQLEREVADLNNHTRFGLVYERHLPETVIVRDTDPLKIDHVRPRRAADVDEDFRVIGLNERSARLLSLKTEQESSAPLAELLPIKRFGDPTPSPTSTASRSVRKKASGRL